MPSRMHPYAIQYSRLLNQLHHSPKVCLWASGA